jgi:hypothetical protein
MHEQQVMPAHRHSPWPGRQAQRTMTCFCDHWKAAATWSNPSAVNHASTSQSPRRRPR